MCNRKRILFLNQTYVVSTQKNRLSDACSNMEANILPVDKSSTRGWGQKVKIFFFLKVVMLHIKLKGKEHRALS